MTDPDASGSVLPLLPWWERWQGRIEWELDCFGRRNLPVTVSEDPREGANRLVLDSEVALSDSETVRVVVVYPDSYPHRPFALYAPDILLPRHQAPNGNLCVFPRGSEQWRPNCSAADSVADDVPHLMRLVREGGDLLRDNEVPQGEPVSAYYNTTAQGCIVIDDRATTDFSPQSGDGGELLIGLNSGADWMLGRPENFGTDSEGGEQRLTMGQGFLRNLRTDNKTLLAEPPTRFAEQYPQDCRGRWIYLDNPPLTHDPEEVWAACVAADASLAALANRNYAQQLVGVCFPEEIQQGVFGIGWTFLYRVVTQTATKPKGRRGGRSGNPAARRNVRNATPFRFVRALRWTDTSLSIRIPELAPLRTKTIAVVGLGSLGAPVALELGKERTHTLRILDGDYMDPGTAVRHPLGLNWAGLSKSLAVGRAVVDHNPEVNVEPTVLNIGQHSLEADGALEHNAILGLLNGANLLISATAEHDVNRYLDDIAASLGVPRLYLWGLSGYGGIVALLDNTTACYHCLNTYLSAQSQAGNPLVQVPEGADATIQGPGCADQTFTGNHTDLQPISNHAVRIANGYLCGPEGGYPRFEHDLYAVQTRERDGRPIPPRWTAHKLPPTPGCPTCPTA